MRRLTRAGRGMRLGFLVLSGGCGEGAAQASPYFEGDDEGGLRDLDLAEPAHTARSAIMSAGSSAAPNPRTCPSSGWPACGPWLRACAANRRVVHSSWDTPMRPAWRKPERPATPSLRV